MSPLREQNKAMPFSAVLKLPHAIRERVRREGRPTPQGIVVDFDAAALLPQPSPQAPQFVMPTWAPLKYPGEYAVITGCDKAHEKYLGLWRRTFDRDNKCRVYFCDFGLSAEGRAIVDAWPNTIVVDLCDLPADMHPWYRKSQGIIRCDTEHLLWVDMDTTFSGDVSGAFSPDGRIYAMDDHPAIVANVPFMVQAGVFAFDHGDPLILQWAGLCRVGDAVAKAVDAFYDLKDQVILSGLLRTHPHRRGVLPTRYNWTPMTFLPNGGHGWMITQPNKTLPDTVITHYCASDGKAMLDRMVESVIDVQTEAQRWKSCLSCNLARKHKGESVSAISQCMVTGKRIADFTWKAQAFCPRLLWGPEQVPLLKWSAAKPFGQGIITGCDSRQGWLIPIFMHYLRRTGCQLPVIFADFGMDTGTKSVAHQFGRVLPSKHQALHPMWQKVIVGMDTPFEWTAWLDIDMTCGVDPIGMFDLEGHTLSVREGCEFYAKRHAVDNYHTGAFVWKHGDEKYQLWASFCALGQEALVTILDDDLIRDEEVFSALARVHDWYGGFHHMQPRYCSLGDEPFTPDRNVHHTGPDGKARIWHWATRDGLVSGSMPDVTKT